MSSFDDIIHDKASGHEAPVPAGAWDKIMPPKRKRRYLLWYWMLGAVIIAGMGIPAMLHFKNQPKSVVAVEQHFKTTPPVTAQHNPILEQAKSHKSNTNEAVSTSATGEADVAPAPKSAGTTEFVASGLKALQQIKPAHKQLNAKANAKVQTGEVIDLLLTPNKENDELKSGANVVASNQSIRKNTSKKVTAKVSTANPEEVLATTESKQSGVMQVVSEEETATVNNVIKAIPSASKLGVALKDSSVSLQPSNTAAITETVKKKKGFTGLFIDLAVIPFIPVQQSGGGAVFGRTTMVDGVRTEFVANQFSSRLSSAIGVQAALRKSIGNRWLIGSGLQYATVKETVELKGEETSISYTRVNRLQTVNNVPVLVIDSVLNIQKGTREINAVNSYRFISIPVFVQYRAGKFAGLDLAITGGAYFTIQSVYSNAITPGVNSSLPVAASKGGVDLFGGLRLSKQFRRFNLFAEPAVRVNLVESNVKNALVSGQVRQFALAVGTAFKLK